MEKLQRHLDEALNEGRHVKRERDRLEEKLMSVQGAAGQQEDRAGRLMQKCDLMEAAMEAAQNAAAQVGADGRGDGGGQSRLLRQNLLNPCGPFLPYSPLPPLV